MKRRFSRIRRSGALLAVITVAGLVQLGCSGLQIRLMNASVEEPSNVAMYFVVRDEEGEPLSGLSAEDFNIYEDGSLISEHESQQTILNPEVSTVRYTLLLLDMSGSVTDPLARPQPSS